MTDIRFYIRNRVIGLSLVVALFIPVLAAQAQQSFIGKDYELFGRKDIASPGSVFSSLGGGAIIYNPAAVALVTDNRISSGMATSDIGQAYHLAWMGPNFSVASARQTGKSNAGGKHEKEILEFCFGVSDKDLGRSMGENRSFAFGVAINRRGDHFDSTAGGNAGGSAISSDIGMLLRIDRFDLEAIIQNVTSPSLSGSAFKYSRGITVGGRFRTSAGLMLALQFQSGDYGGSDFGLHVGAEQSFYEGRLVSRIQLTSFFKASRAVVQNLSGGLAYRLNPSTNNAAFLKDLEFGYAMSFLALPRVVGTHMLSVAKYF